MLLNLANSASSILDIFQEVFLWTAIFISLLILLPQVAALRRNKYADNSSIWIYILYTVCNSIWAIYQVIIIVNAYVSKDNKFLTIFYIQLFGDFIQLFVGYYSIALKAYYSRNKNIKKDKTVEKILKQRAQINEQLNKQKSWLIQQIDSLKSLFPNEYKKIKKIHVYRKLNFENYKDITVTSIVNFICDFTGIVFNKKNINNLKAAECNELYNSQKSVVKSHIQDLYKIYPDIVIKSNHHKIKKSFHLSNREKINNYQDYMEKASLTNVWAYLAEIYQNMLSI